MKQAYIRPEIRCINLNFECKTCLTISANEGYIDASDSFTNQKDNDMTEFDWETEYW